MSVIRVPKPPAGAFKKDRPISSLLKTQIRHLQEAEFRLPARHQTDVYINTIKTEGEAADYIRRVTGTLHAQHDATLKPAPAPGAKKKSAAGLRLAAAARRKRQSKSKTTTGGASKAGGKRRTTHRT